MINRNTSHESRVTSHESRVGLGRLVTRDSRLVTLLLLALLALPACGEQGGTATSTPGSKTPAPTSAAGQPTTGATGTTPQANKGTQPPGRDVPLVRIGFAFATSGDNGVYGK